MKSKYINKNQEFIGRSEEVDYLFKIGNADKASILIIYGRRRIGKTELIEQTFRDRHLLKFEGIEGEDESWQQQEVMRQLSIYTQEPLLQNIKVNSWIDVFEYINKYISKGEWTLYFEELQWLTNYNTRFISELKFAWDNYFKNNKKLLLILCGSSPSFMINHVVHSKALYNRSQHELALKELNPIETQKLLKKQSLKDIMDAYLTVGGIPEYLFRLKEDSSLFLSLCNNAFVKNGFFTNEYHRIFVSSLSNNPHYEKVIQLLSKKKYATRTEIMKHLNTTSGGRISELLLDLETCGFIEKNHPYNQTNATKNALYNISDAYLQFYFKFIQPIKSAIQKDKFIKSSTQAINRDTYAKWLGYSFERFCKRYAHIIADILGFSAVKYRAGSYFKQGNNSETGTQIDLIFDRDDHVITICEIKYLSTKVSKRVINEFEKKCELLGSKKTIHKVLIIADEADHSVDSYFDRIINLNDLFNPHYW